MSRDLDYRRIQRTGRGSYIVSLPKKWVQDLQLVKGNLLAFEIQEDSSLLLVPRKILEGKEKTMEPTLKEYRISVSLKDDPESICRKIISLYVISADLIQIRYRDGEIPAEHKASINNLHKNMLLGSEIIEETTNEITIQVLIDHPDFPVDRAIRRMTVLALSANRDAIMMLEKGEENLLDGITQKCNDVKRLNLYVIRQLKYGLEKNLFKDLGFKSQKEFLGYRIVANDLNSIANKAVNLAYNIKTVKKMIKDQTLHARVDEEIHSQILDFNSQAQNLFEESLLALFKRDYRRADKLITKRQSFNPLENELITIISIKKLDPNISSIFRLILDSSRRIVEHSLNIAEVTLNRTVDDVSQKI